MAKKTYLVPTVTTLLATESSKSTGSVSTIDSCGWTQLSKHLDISALPSAPYLVMNAVRFLDINALPFKACIELKVATPKEVRKAEVAIL
jgi:hypothetical protein